MQPPRSDFEAYPHHIYPHLPTFAHIDNRYRRYNRYEHSSTRHDIRSRRREWEATEMNPNIPAIMSTVIREDCQNWKIFRFWRWEADGGK